MPKPESILSRGIQETQTLMQVAQGKEPADLAVVNARVLNVYTGEVLEDHAVCTSGRWIAYVGEEPGATLGRKTLVIDAGGKTIIPGLIDGHTHLAWLATPAALLQYALQGGTTCIVSETLEPYPVAGLAGVIDFLDSLRGQPIKIFATAPPMASISKAVRGIPLEDLQTLLDREEVLGLGESYWQSVLQEPAEHLPAITATLQAGKLVEGHSAGAGLLKLMAYLAAGVTSCHEPIKPEEVLARLRLGVHVMVREGSIRRDLEEIAKIRDSGVDLRRLTLVSDGLEPGELMENGYMDFIVQKAIDCGFDPVEAVRMATLNAAEHLRMDHLLGGIAPGRYADLVIIPDIRTIKAETVVSNGKIIADEGKILTSPQVHAFGGRSRQSIKLQAPLEPKDFSIPAPGSASQARVRVIDMVTDLVTRELILEVPVTEGEILPHAGRGILKVAAVDRTVQPGKTFVGLMHGFGLQAGALACSAGWDTSDIIVVGAQEGDMALAVNRIIAMQGGAVICRQGKILAELRMPIFGIMSDLPLPEIDSRIKAITQAASQLGVSFADPLLSLVTLTGAAIPFLRICEQGLVDLKTGKPVELFI